VLPFSFIALLDANVLFPFTLRDILLRAAAVGYFQVRWSAQILDEMTRNLVSAGTMTEEKAVRLRAVMEQAFPEAAVAGYEPLVATMRNEAKDRHVAAAALAAGAQVILTSNRKDFADLPGGIEAQSPDEFLCDLFDLDRDGFLKLLRDQAADLARPPITFDELLERLSRVVPVFVAAAREHAASREK
jgi:predicted nucleic acid-binding protein